MTDTIVPEHPRSDRCDRGPSAPSGDEDQVNAITDAAQSALDQVKQDPSLITDQSKYGSRRTRHRWRRRAATAVRARVRERTACFGRSAHGRPRPHLDRGDRRHGRRPRRPGSRGRRGRHRLRVDAGALSQLGDPGDLDRGGDGAGRRGHRDRVGVHAQPVHPRCDGARRRRDVGRAVPAGAGGGGQAAERDLARSGVRPARAAPSRDRGGRAADHGEGARPGEPIRYEGTYHDIDIKGWVRPHAPVRERVPIYTAAVREGMARMAGDVADGLIGHPMCSLRWLDEVLVANFEAGPPALRALALGLRLHPHRLLRDLGRRGGGVRGLQAHDLLLRDRSHLRAALGDARLR